MKKPGSMHHRKWEWNRMDAGVKNLGNVNDTLLTIFNGNENQNEETQEQCTIET